MQTYKLSKPGILAACQHLAPASALSIQNLSSQLQQAGCWVCWLAGHLGSAVAVHKWSQLGGVLAGGFCCGSAQIVKESGTSERFISAIYQARCSRLVLRLMMFEHLSESCRHTCAHGLPSRRTGCHLPDSDQEERKRGAYGVQVFTMHSSSCYPVRSCFRL